MTYVVLDLEWNQSPDGKENSIEHFPFEIIEIGAVKLNEEMKQISTFQRFVRPVVYKEIHYKISEVTHIDPERLEREGVGFVQAARQFLEWCQGSEGAKEAFVFATWGPMDLTEFQRNMEYHGMKQDFPMPFLYYDIQKLYSLIYGDGKDKLSLDQVVENLSLSAGRPFHQALEDAIYTARIMQEIDFQKVRDYVSIDYYRLPRSGKEEIYFTFPDYSKFVSRTFETKEDAIADKRVTDMVCYCCHRMLRKRVRWFTANQRTYYGLAFCPEHGYLKGKIRMKKAENGSYFAVKTLKLVGEDRAEEILEKRDEYRKKRNQRNRMKRQRKKQP